MTYQRYVCIWHHLVYDTYVHVVFLALVISPNRLVLLRTKG